MNNEIVTIKVKCRYCGSFHFIKVRMADYRKFTTGMLCRDYFPNLTEEGFNLLTFEICPDCFNDIFLDY